MLWLPTTQQSSNNDNKYKAIIGHCMAFPNEKKTHTIYSPIRDPDMINVKQLKRENQQPN